MSLDEALLERGGSTVLRFYTWSPDTLSLGYFQRLADVPAAERFFVAAFGDGPDPEGARPGALVRRLTGGGAIHHQHELTFSLTTGLDHPLYAGPTERSYQRVHAAIARALAEVGVRAAERGPELPRSERAGTGMCFHKSAAVDLVWDGLKGVGSAQRRKAGRVLHHGSIKLGTTPLEGEIATLSGPVGLESLASLVEAELLTAAREAGDTTADGATALAPTDLAPEVLTQAKTREPFFTSEPFLARR